MPAPLLTKRLQVRSFYQASSELSGDMFDYAQVDESHYNFLILDVMGHGLSASLLSMSLRSFMSEAITRQADVSKVMGRLNAHLRFLLKRNQHPHLFCTAIYLSIDTEARRIEYINAGHPPALWIGSHGEQKEFSSSTPPLGLFPDVDFVKGSFNYLDGGRLLMYTDGVLDVINAERLCFYLTEYAEGPVEALKSAILQELELSKESDHDDRCMLLIDVQRGESKLAAASRTDSTSLEVKANEADSAANGRDVLQT